MINSSNGTKMENSGPDFAVFELQNKRWKSPAQLEECFAKTKRSSTRSASTKSSKGQENSVHWKGVPGFSVM
jgi:hypothetical protein